jgi:leader peptidase (prepilin peptidase) / N-methyltransferase
VSVALAALFGLVFGSFLTVVVARVPVGEAITGRSRCPRCGAAIAPRDNVPVVSFMLLRGRCRRCGARISPEYPLTEAGTAALFAGAFAAYDDVVVAGLMAAFLGMLFALALTDLHHRVIPNRIVLPGLAVFALALGLARLDGRDVDLSWAGLGLVLYGGGLLVIALVAPRGMGMGDVKLAALIGLVLGSQGPRFVAVAAVLGILAGGVGGVVALLAGRSRKAALPFGPFLAAGAIVAAFWAGPIAAAYLDRLG